MKIQPAIWFVAGVVCGVGGLYAGMTLLGHGPRMAAGETASPSAETLSLLKKIDATTSAPARSVSPSREARMASLQSDLQTVRSQMELYKIQHMDKYPGSTAGGTFDAQLMVQQLVNRTTGTGGLAARPGVTDRLDYGPYLQNFPSNAFVTGPSASAILSGMGPAPHDGKSGWWVDIATGKLYANDTVSKD